MAKKNEKDFESSMQRLSAIVQELERADPSLERNVALYKEGRKLAAACKVMLDQARNEIRLCGENGDEAFALSPKEGLPDA